MKLFIMKFPGDPPMAVTEITRAEFLALCPRQPIRLTNLVTGAYEEFPMGYNEIYCDFCNDDPGETVVTLAPAKDKTRILRGYCLPCAKKMWYRYCTEVTSKGVS